MQQPGMTRTRRRSGWLGQRASRLLTPVALLLMWSMAAAQKEVPQGWEEVEAHKKADVAAQLLMSTLQAQLNSALSSGGPVKAMEVCSEVAQAVTLELSQREGVSVRRTALRVRNPANRPDDFERAWLESAQRTVANGGAAAPVYEITRSGARCELRHLRPIVFPGGVCAQCHGRDDEISPQVRALLRKRYPRDQATGFAPGDLRGAISVRVTVREPCSSDAPVQAPARNR